MDDSRLQDDAEQLSPVFRHPLSESGTHTIDNRHYRLDASVVERSVCLLVAELLAVLLGWWKVYPHQPCRQHAAPSCSSSQIPAHRLPRALAVDRELRPPNALPSTTRRTGRAAPSGASQSLTVKLGV